MSAVGKNSKVDRNSLLMFEKHLSHLNRSRAGDLFHRFRGSLKACLLVELVLGIFCLFTTRIAFQLLEQPTTVIKALFLFICSISIFFTFLTATFNLLEYVFGTPNVRIVLLILGPMTLIWLIFEYYRPICNLATNSLKAPHRTTKPPEPSIVYIAFSNTSTFIHGSPKGLGAFSVSQSLSST